MKIERIVFNKNIAEITADGEVYSMCTECVISNRINVNCEFSREKFYSFLEESEYILCKNYLFTQIEKYAKTEKGYKDKLYSKGFSTKAINAAIDYAKQKNYIDDIAFAERYYQANSSRKGARRIAAELRSKGVKTENLSFVYEQETDKNTIKILAEKFLKSREKTFDTKNKLIRHLMSKGFNYDEVMDITNELFTVIDEY